MKTYDSEEYLGYRKCCVLNYEKHDGIYTGRRGQYVRYPSHIIHWTVGDLSEPVGRLKKIVDSEKHLVWDGSTLDQKLEKELYENDDKLLEAYRSLHLVRLLNAQPSSRNNVICNPLCCLCTWQRFDNKLFVISRSMDLRVAGLSDIHLVDVIAGLLGVVYRTIVNLNPHQYTDNMKIARRQNG